MFFFLQDLLVCRLHQRNPGSHEFGEYVRQRMEADFRKLLAMRYAQFVSPVMASCTILVFRYSPRTPGSEPAERHFRFCSALYKKPCLAVRRCRHARLWLSPVFLSSSVERAMPSVLSCVDPRALSGSLVESVVACSSTGSSQASCVEASGRLAACSSPTPRQSRW